MNEVVKLLSEITMGGSVLIVVIILLRHILKGRINPRLQYALWSIVLIRLLLPISIESQYSMMNYVDIPTQQREAQYFNIEENIPRNSSVDSDKVFEQSTDQIKYIQHEKIDKYISVNPLETSQTILFVIWIAGMVITFLYFFIINLFFVLNYKKTCIPYQLSEKHIMLFKEFNKGKRIPVYLCDSVPSPCLCGILMPKILLTSKAVQSEETLKYTLLHELNHLKQYDNIISLLRSIVCVLYWFNPFVWLASNISRKDCETACDSAILRKLDSYETMSYGKTLIKLVQQEGRKSGISSISTTMTAGKKEMKNRIHLIAKPPKMLITTVLTVFAIIIATVFVTCTGAKSDVKFVEENTSILIFKEDSNIIAGSLSTRENVKFVNTINSIKKKEDKNYEIGMDSHADYMFHIIDDTRKREYRSNSYRLMCSEDYTEFLLFEQEDNDAEDETLKRWYFKSEVLSSFIKDVISSKNINEINRENITFEDVCLLLQEKITVKDFIADNQWTLIDEEQKLYQGKINDFVIKLSVGKADTTKVFDSSLSQIRIIDKLGPEYIDNPFIEDLVKFLARRNSKIDKSETSEWIAVSDQDIDVFIKNESKYKGGPKTIQKLYGGIIAVVYWGDKNYSEYYELFKNKDGKVYDRRIYGFGENRDKYIFSMNGGTASGHYPYAVMQCMDEDIISSYRKMVVYGEHGEHVIYEEGLDIFVVPTQELGKIKSIAAFKDDDITDKNNMIIEYNFATKHSIKGIKNP